MPLGFTFWLKTKTAEIPAATALPDVDFGNPVFYANNLSASGDIDAGLSGNQLELFPGSGSPAEKTAALCNHLPSAKIPPATYTMVQIGRASCRERLCQYVYITVGAVSLQKTLKNISIVC